MHTFRVGDRVKFDYEGKADTGTVGSCERSPHFLLIYMDNDRNGHHRNGRCWWVPPEELTPLKSKTKRFL